MPKTEKGLQNPPLYLLMESLNKFQLLLHRQQFDMFDFHHKNKATILFYNEANREEYIVK